MSPPLSTPGAMHPLLQAALDLQPLLRREAAEAERRGRLSDATVAALHDSGLLAMWVPEHFGGAELDPCHSLAVVEAISYADGSTGWVHMAASLSTGTGASYLAPEAARQLFDRQLSVIAGHGAPLGRAEVIPGGFRLSGEWSYASGLRHAQFVHTGGIVYQGGLPRIDPLTGQPEFRVFVVPVQAATLGGNWDSLGLRATGSIDYRMEDVDVPEGFTHLQHLRAANTGGDLYRLGIMGFACLGHSGFALGLGRRLLDELAFLVRSREARPFVLALPGGGDSFQEQYGHHEAAFRAARALTYQAWEEMQAALFHTPSAASGPVPTRTMTLVRLALNHLTTVANDLAGFAFTFGGGRALRDGDLQRCVRDMMTGAQHASTSPQILRECAKDLLGVAPGKVWAMRGLVDPVPPHGAQQR